MGSINLTMTEPHLNLALQSKLDFQIPDASTELFTESFVWHYFNPKLPDVEGDYVGIEGLIKYFETIAVKTNATFKVEPDLVTPVGDELLVFHVRDSLLIDGNTIEIDVVVVWRVVDGKFTETRDIPSAFTQANE